jgi:chromosome segregation ATPase
VPIFYIHLCSRRFLNKKMSAVDQQAERAASMPTSSSAVEEAPTTVAAPAAAPLEALLAPLLSTSDAINRAGAMQHKVHNDLRALVEAMRAVEAACAERNAVLPSQLDEHVQWVKGARQRAFAVRNSLKDTRERLGRVLDALTVQERSVSDEAKRAEAQLAALEASIATSPAAAAASN